MSLSLKKNLNTFNLSQLSAVKTLDGPLLVSAGAGSGKTRVLTHRIAHIIKQKKALPHQILAVTFTNKAAKEMQERVYNLIKELNIDIKGRMWISTFHSLSARILKEHKKLITKQNIFTIYDSKDQLSLVKKVMRDLNINEKVYNPKSFSAQIALSKRQGLNPEDIDKSKFPGNYINHFKEIYFHYQKELYATGAFDFEGLLLETYKLFLKFPEILEKYRNQFRYISVDEYQDTNHIQYLIIKTLAEKHRNICVVGDEDQSIYSWRGADISNILNFDRDFPECKIVKLEQNYRSSRNIISAASALISLNSLRQKKNLFTENPTGELIQLYELENEYKEAYLIANIINSSCKEHDYSYEDFAIFYRTNAQSRVLEDALRSQNIPYRIVGNLKFYDRLEVKDILSYLKFISNSQDEVSLKRILNSPKRGIGSNTIHLISKESQRIKKSFYETMKYLSETNQIQGKARPGILEFIQIMEYLKSLKNTLPLPDFYKEVLEKTGYEKSLKNDNSIESISRLENLLELGTVISQFSLENKSNSIDEFLEEIALIAPSDKDSKESGITLMTLHVSKGLEFNTVFITGLEEGLFPLFQNTDEQNLEEERRLAYVGMTRAKKNLYLSYAVQRNKFGKTQYNQASQFLQEIPEEYIHLNSFRKKNKSFSNRKKYINYEQKPLNHRFYSSPDESSLKQNSSQNFRTQYKEGQIVSHPYFGTGKIQKVEGSGEDLRVSVLFKNQKLKKFIAKYAHFSV